MFCLVVFNIFRKNIVGISLVRMKKRQKNGRCGGIRELKWRLWLFRFQNNSCSHGKVRYSSCHGNKKQAKHEHVPFLGSNNAQKYFSWRLHLAPHTRTLYPQIIPGNNSTHSKIKHTKAVANRLTRSTSSMPILKQK